MATAKSDTDDSLDDNSGSSDTCEDSDAEFDCQSRAKQRPCKYYNKGHCRDGAACLYLHICQYALKGNCRYGAKCKLKHPPDGSGSSHAVNSTDPKLTSGQKYQSIKIYNTPHGAVSIDFKRIRVCGKNLSVRRLDDGTTTWVWYCTLGRKWRKYGDKDSKGNTSSVTSSDIEKKFQSNPTGSFTFSIGGENLEIKFREMQQVGTNRKRKVTRRPVYRQPAGTGSSQVTRALQNMSVANKPQWEFEGNGGRWHRFKNESGTCSVSNDDIERNYQQNSSGHMAFKVNGQPYKLDFAAMTQTNLLTKATRKIRRV
ncbi:hypothetical protein Q5P01_003653 [Channa striata]|uniref:Uncharacterized protein n=1 Tax=Channa striata TaxID=64152 RepID=A0AA88T0I7_CHASR|nr:hypothetical protein Q5P01_003653 [Channa striata]